MADFVLTAAPPLGGFREDFASVRLEEPEGLAIVAVAASATARQALAQAIEDSLGAALPGPGSSTLSADGRYRLAWTAPDQTFILFDHGVPDAGSVVETLVGGAGYVTDQTDGWAALRLSGPRSRDVLARLCMLDLHPDVFAPGASARTMMEHLGVIVIREDADTYLLLSASSSAQSFLGAVTDTIRALS